MRQHYKKVSIELLVTTKHRRDMTDNVESDVKPEQTNKQTNNMSLVVDRRLTAVKNDTNNGYRDLNLSKVYAYFHIMR